MLFQVIPESMAVPYQDLSRGNLFSQLQRDRLIAQLSKDDTVATNLPPKFPLLRWSAVPGRNSYCYMVTILHMIKTRAPLSPSLFRMDKGISC